MRLAWEEKQKSKWERNLELDLTLCCPNQMGKKPHRAHLPTTQPIRDYGNREHIHTVLNFFPTLISASPPKPVSWWFLTVFSILCKRLLAHQSTLICRLGASGFKLWIVFLKLSRINLGLCALGKVLVFIAVWSNQKLITSFLPARLHSDTFACLLAIIRQP